VRQLTLGIAPPPGPGHNQPPEPIDPSEGLDRQLSARHADLVARFRDLELRCARVPDPVESDEDAARLTDFIAQCQAHIKRAEAAHKTEKAPFLKAGRLVDGFFKRRCEQLLSALAPAIARLKSYRDEVARIERQRHEQAQRAAAELARQAMAEAEEHRDLAERLAREGKSIEDRLQAADELRLAEEAAQLAHMASSQAKASLKPTRLHGDYGSTAYVSHSWAFEVIDLDRVPREYMSLDVAVVRDAITRNGVREIPGLRIFQTEALRVRGAL
jgi:hypothetical protein